MLRAALLAGVAASELPSVYQDATFDVAITNDVTYAQGLTCTDNQFAASDCKAMDLELDVYEPVGRSGGPVVPAAKPAYVMMHGGGNTGGCKGFNNVNVGKWWAARGFVAFDINYRLDKHKGLLPTTQGRQRLVTHVDFSDKSGTFTPHPTASSNGTYSGPLKLDSDQHLCMSVDGSDGKSVLLEACVEGAASQQWHMRSFATSKQAITHIASGHCLDIPSAARTRAVGLPVEVSLCETSPASDSTQRWQLGSGGLLQVRAGSSASVPWPGPDVMFVKAVPELILGWNPQWASAYPATRDAKASIRFVRAAAAEYGVDVGRIASSGGSAGATDMLAAGVSFEKDFKDEITVDQDPTLASTHLNMSSAVQCMVLHWSSDGGIALVEDHNPGQGDRYRASNPPIVELHGDQDTTIPISHAYAVQSAYAKTGVAYNMQVLKGCGHAAWCYDGQGQCSCSGATWSPLMEELAFPTVASSLDLKVVGTQVVV